MNVYRDMDRAYRDVLAQVLVDGREVRPRGQSTLELLHFQFTLEDATRNLVSNPVRRANHMFSVAEWLWILLGRRDVASIAYFNKNIAAYSDDGETYYGAYGPWVVSQLPYVVRTLRADPDSRQAVMTIWQQTPPPTKDVPCTVALQFMLRDGCLHAQAFMRSNDAWLGLPYDVFNFTRIQAWVAAVLGVPAGQYTHTVGSMHLYERDQAKARDACFEECPEEPYASPALVRVSQVELAGAFAAAADPLAAPMALFELPEPWATYIDLLRYRTTKDRALLRAPYDRLVPWKKETVVV